MITEDFFSFDVAQLLKEKGFDELCIFKYNSEGVRMKSGSAIDEWQNSELDDDECSCVSHQMAMRWLREVHKIDVWVEGWNRRYKGNIHSEQRGEEALFYEDSYEKAVEAALKYCLENLI